MRELRQFTSAFQKKLLYFKTALNRTSTVTILDIISRLFVSFRSCFGCSSVLVMEKLILDFLHMCLVLFGCAVERPQESLLALRVLLQTVENKIHRHERSQGG
jgi:hypothetical protein